MVLGEATGAQVCEAGEASVAGDGAGFQTLLDLLDRFDFWFEIIAP